MIVVFIAWNDYSGLVDAVDLAMLRSGCEVAVISEKKIKCSEWINIHDFKSHHLLATIENRTNDRMLLSRSICRWFVLQEYLKSKTLDAFPVLCLDWDVLVFINLVEAYAPFCGFDFTHSVIDGHESAAYGINNRKSLDSFCDMILRMCEPGATSMNDMNDMMAWKLNRIQGNLTAGNLYEEINGSVFDHNVCLFGNRFADAGGAKKIVWKSGIPHFLDRSTGRPIKANTIHCWGSFKSRTSEMKKHAMA